MTDYPQEGELVIATVTKIHFHSIFCKLDEYDQTGMIHISELAPGRIKNVNEYVKEGKVVIAKVLRVDQAKGHIDLSLRRVTEAQRKQKAAQRKQAALVENIITQVAKTTKTNEAELLSALTQAFPEEVLYNVFVEYVEEQRDLSPAQLDTSLLQALQAAITDRIKPKSVMIKAQISIKTHAPDGVQQIQKAWDALPEGMNVYYAGAGAYIVELTAKEYKVAEEELKGFREELTQALPEAEISYERVDK